MKKNLYEVTLLYTTDEGDIQTPEDATIGYVIATDPANALIAIQAKFASGGSPLAAKRITIEKLPYHYIILADQPEQ